MVLCFFAIIFLILEKTETSTLLSEGVKTMGRRPPEIDVDLYADVYGPGSGDDIEELLAQGYDIDDLYAVGLLEDDDDLVPSHSVASQEPAGPRPLSDEMKRILKDIEEHPEDYPLPF
jgi:hypothetical protein